MEIFYKVLAGNILLLITTIVIVTMSFTPKEIESSDSPWYGVFGAWLLLTIAVFIATALYVIVTW